MKHVLLQRSRLRLQVRLWSVITAAAFLGLLATSEYDLGGVRPILLGVVVLGAYSLHRQLHELLHLLVPTTASPWPARLWRPSRAQSRERFESVLMSPGGRAAAARGYVEGKEAAERLRTRLAPGTDVRVWTMMAARLAALALSTATGEAVRVCAHWLEDPEVSTQLEALARS